MLKKVSVGPKAGRGSGNDLISLVQGDSTRGVKNKEKSKDSFVFGTKSKEAASLETIYERWNTKGLKTDLRFCKGPREKAKGQQD